jgi:hypothetical protein
MAWEEEQLETQMRQQAAQRHNMEKRRNLHQDADNKFNRQLDEMYTKEERAAERLRGMAKERQGAAEERQAKYQEKRDKIAASRLEQGKTALLKAKSVEGSTTPRQSHSPRELSPRRAGTWGRGPRGPSGADAGGRHAMTAGRRLETERQVLIDRIAREEQRLENIKHQKEEHHHVQMTRRMETMRLTKPQAADATLDDDEPAGASTADLKSKRAGASRPRHPRMQSPRRTARKAPKTEELTKAEKERLGIIKKQRCAVCERVYELENLPVPPHASRPGSYPAHRPIAHTSG